MNNPVELRPATLDDRRRVYEWMARSDLTASMMGPPEFDEAPSPTWEAFCADYEPYFFDGSRPRVGRSFIIDHAGEAVGHVSYIRMNERESFAELDIWMRDSSYCGQGFGSAALDALVRLLHNTFGVREFILRPSARNVRAIRAYEKASFARMTLSADELAAIYGPGEYRDTVVLRRFIGEPAGQAGKGVPPLHCD